MTPHYPFSNISSEVGESEVTNAHRLRWCQWTLGHRSGYFVRPKTTKLNSAMLLELSHQTWICLHIVKPTTKSNCRLVPTKARSMSKMDGGSEATKMS
jgi:hypothetical protein